ncbi:MAG: HPr family phosphocarrier protein [Lentisphaerae bacterium]|nr:HPr family phosphocarrier protein [Lentisphaerota bacterium]
MTERADNDGRLTREFKVLNQYGLHARPAALFAKIASRFDADVTVDKNGNVVSGKSIMGLMTLEAGRDSVLRVTAVGDGAEQLLDELEALFQRKFDEE